MTTAESADLVLSDLVTQLEKHEAELKNRIEAWTLAVDQVRDELERVEAGRDVHHAEQILQDLAKLPKSHDYSKLQSLREKAELAVSLFKELLLLLDAKQKSDFEAAFESVRTEVSKLYCQLAARPDFTDLWIDTGNWDVLAGVGDAGKVATTVLNIGDLTAAAICLFLVSASRAHHRAGFILLDDPSQSLDLAHKRRLAAILADLALDHQILVTSADAGFVNELLTVGTVSRRIIEFEPWNPELGCRANTEDV